MNFVPLQQIRPHLRGGAFCPSPPTVVRYVRSTKDPVLAVVQGPSPHGEQYRTIVYKRGATEVVHDRAFVKRLTAVRATSPPPSPMETPVQLAGR